MTEYCKKPTQIRDSIADEISAAREKMRFCLQLKNRYKRGILDYKDVFLFANNLSNLVSFGFFNHCNIFYENKNKRSYNKKVKEVLPLTE